MELENEACVLKQVIFCMLRVVRIKFLTRLPFAEGGSKGPTILNVYSWKFECCTNGGNIRLLAFSPLNKVLL